MEKFKVRGQTYSAWSEMKCGDKNSHAPHSWNSEAMCFGPYFCRGIEGGDCPCAVQCGHAIDYHFLRTHESGLIRMCVQCYLDSAAALEAANDNVRKLTDEKERLEAMLAKAMECVAHYNNDRNWRDSGQDYADLYDGDDYYDGYDFARKIKAEIESIAAAMTDAGERG